MQNKDKLQQIAQRLREHARETQQAYYAIQMLLAAEDLESHVRSQPSLAGLPLTERTPLLAS